MGNYSNTPSTSKVNWLSQLCIWWILPLIRLGRKRELQPQDISHFPQENSAKDLGLNLGTFWEKEVQGEDPKLSNAVYKTFRKSYLRIALFLAFRDFFIRQFSRVGQGVAVGSILSYFDGSYTQAWGYGSGVALVVLVFLNALTTQLIILKSSQLGMQVRVSLTGLVYSKVLNLGLGMSGMGHITNLISNDANRFDRYMFPLVYIGVAPAQFLIILIILWIYMGPSVVGGLAWIIIIIPVQLYLGNLVNQYRHSCAKLTEARVRHTTECIRGIELIKMSTLEIPFAAIISAARAKELKEFLWRFRVVNCHVCFAEVSIKFSQFLILLAYVLFGNFISAKNVFVMITLMCYLGSSMSTNFPLSLQGSYDCLACLQRMQAFLTLPEKKVQDDLGNMADTSTSQVLKLENVSATWPYETTPVLTGVTLSLQMGQLLGVVGSVGSGKSTLLKLILREIPLTSGEIRVGTKKVAYVSQEPWIFPASLLENVLFGEPYDEKWFKRVVEACALDRDLSLMPDGEQAFLGDRGVILSGGQKARVNLARAVYSDADLYLLDDPLSAVDVEVAKTIMSECIRGILRSKAIILVTHQVQYLEDATEIILLQNGRVESRGVFADVIGTIDSEVDVVDDLGIDPQPNLDVSNNQIDTTLSLPNVGGYGTFKSTINETEQNTTGGVQMILHWQYWSATGVAPAFFLLFLFILVQVWSSGADYWLRTWAQMANDFREAESDGMKRKELQSALTYLGLVMGFGLSALWQSMLFAQLCNSSGRLLHERLLERILRAPMRFFQVNTPGRVLNRIVNDMGVVDEFLQLYYRSTLRPLFQVLGLIVVIAILSPYTLIPGLIMLCIYAGIRNFYIRAGTSLKRLEAYARSPLFGIFNSTVTGIVTIRASRSQEMMRAEFWKLQDAHTSAYFNYIGAARWFAFWLDLTTAIYATVVILACFCFEGIDTATAGLAISSVIQLAVATSAAGTSLADLENCLISVERILEYSNGTPEAEPTIPGCRPPLWWPRSGRILFKSCSVRYGSNPLILHSVNFEIAPGERIGVVGRTGAGKSSLISALFRLVELQSGAIHIDSVDVSRIGLRDLRSKMSIIPQNPVLFIGTLRLNLDPFGRCSDLDLVQVLKQIDFMSRFFEGENPLGLDTRISAGGENLSHGERQLLCLARAMLQKTQILILDEATAHVDGSTDSRIQSTLRTKFKDISVIIVAHRLSTVMDNDKILVLSDGRVLEFDHPYILLQNPNGCLFKLCQKAGPGFFSQFLRMAVASYERKNGTN